ncbi:MAG TPA: leucine-rich repeat domain-containing protein [Candidatus Hydrogenedentes bacterium]|nr:leucine-rich repeat domain-containing protein [Candidatus Hydrogenedentota bacterium]HPG68459.1 leucine-rich repeat domain-containing protein [Candidatus Hydrogenedentota bacterium]
MTRIQFGACAFSVIVLLGVLSAPVLAQGAVQITTGYVSACPGSAEGEGEGEFVVFDDPRLETAVREAIGKPVGPIVPEDMLGLTTLVAEGRKIVSLVGLEYATNLSDLRLAGNLLEDVTPLDGLRQLEHLDLSSNRLRDVSALQNATALRTLRLANNRISDLTPLAALVSIEVLDLSGNEVGVITALSSLTNLEGLNLAANRIVSLSPLASLSALERLDVERNRVSDLTPLTKLIGLSDLRLDVNRASDLRPLMANRGLSVGDYVSLAFNPVDAYALCTIIPALKARGVTVIHQSKCPAFGEGIRESLDIVYFRLLWEPATADREPNGIADVAHVLLLDAMLASAVSPHYVEVLSAWQLNYRKTLNALADVPEEVWEDIAPVDLARAAAGLITLGEAKSVLAGLDLLAWFGLAFEPEGFDRSAETILSAVGDADDDGVCNLGEYTAWVTDIYSYGDFVAAALDLDVTDDGGGCPGSEGEGEGEGEPDRDYLTARYVMQPTPGEGEGEGEGEGKKLKARRTEPSSENPLTDMTLLFTPDGSKNFYSPCIVAATAYPTDPSTSAALPLGDDDWAQIDLANGRTVGLYGVSYSTLFVGSNGYITFTQGDAEYEEDLEAHFALPRVSALFDDLAPQDGGTISWKQFDNQVVVTFDDVPERNIDHRVYCQVALFFDGRIAITWLTSATVDGIVGLSDGKGMPAFFTNTDFTASPECDPGSVEPGTGGEGEGEGECVTPAAPADIEATDGFLSDRIHVIWTPVPHAKEYQVYRGLLPVFGEATAVSGWITGNVYEDTTALEPTVVNAMGCFDSATVYHYYYYWVVARDRDCVGPPSESDLGHVGVAADAKAGLAASASTAPRSPAGQFILIVLVAAVLACSRKPVRQTPQR